MIKYILWKSIIKKGNFIEQILITLSRSSTYYQNAKFRELRFQNQNQCSNVYDGILPGCFKKRSCENKNKALSC